MNFNSIDDAIKYIEGVCQNGLKSMGKEMTDIMEDEIFNQIYLDHIPKYYERTGDLLDTPKATVSTNNVSAEFEDNGDWSSVRKGHPHFFPLIAWEETGTVWRSKDDGGGFYPKTKIVNKSYQRCDKEIPPKFKEYLIKKGLDVK